LSHTVPYTNVDKLLLLLKLLHYIFI